MKIVNNTNPTPTMQLQQLKQQVHALANTKTTKQLKTYISSKLGETPNLSKKSTWEYLYQVLSTNAYTQDISLEDLEASEQQNFNSLTKLYEATGHTKAEAYDKWQEIQTKSQNRDVHIEEL